MCSWLAWDILVNAPPKGNPKHGEILKKSIFIFLLFPVRLQDSTDSADACQSASSVTLQDTLKNTPPLDSLQILKPLEGISGFWWSFLQVCVPSHSQVISRKWEKASLCSSLPFLLRTIFLALAQTYLILHLMWSRRAVNLQVGSRIFMKRRHNSRSSLSWNG